jgi:hypothetical protein
MSDKADQMNSSKSASASGSTPSVRFNSDANQVFEVEPRPPKTKASTLSSSSSSSGSEDIGVPSSDESFAELRAPEPFGTGYVWHEEYMWHDTASQSMLGWYGAGIRRKFGQFNQVYSNAPSFILFI